MTKVLNLKVNPLEHLSYVSMSKQIKKISSQAGKGYATMATSAAPS